MRFVPTKTGSSVRDLELLELVHDAIIVADANGIYLTWNASAERMYGYSAAEAIGQPFTMLYFPEDIPTVAADLLRSFETNDVQEFTLRARRKDGGEIFVALRLSVVRDAQGKIVHYVGCSNDITERKRAEDALKREIDDRIKLEDALRSSEQRSRHLLASGPAVLYTCRPSGDYGATYVSPNAQALFGYDPNDFIREPHFWVERIHPDDRDRVWADFVENLPSGRTYAEYRFLHADGCYRWIRDVTVVIHDTGGDAIEIIGHMTDVTLEKEGEAVRREHERLQYFSEALLTAQEAERKRVSRELHDDLNQRLAALILEMGAVERHLPESAENARESCTLLKKRVAAISDDVRRISLQLHSAGLEHFGLAATLRQECATLEQRTGTRIA
ncbi:MAG TPA: PAS domain-containing protein, partial [Terriglobales bacterium]|nr:PAS domain-containing protein [Terriglobales bacterium]